MKIKLSQYNPRKPDLATTKVSILIKGITLEILEIILSSFAIHVMKRDTLLEIFLETKVALTRRRETREDIMLMLQRMMKLPQRETRKHIMLMLQKMMSLLRRESDKTVMILQVMKNMF